VEIRLAILAKPSKQQGEAIKQQQAAAIKQEQQAVVVVPLVGVP
jgi:hypothetical protein